MTTPASSISPSDHALAKELRDLRVQYPTTGAAKLVPLLLASNPTWTVSEKRVRKILQKEGLSTSAAPGATPNKGSNVDEDDSFPTSHIVDSVDPAKWSKKVRVADFGSRKGKGLVATEPIAENEHIWVEDPLITSPESELDQLHRNGQACLYCSKIIRSSGGYHIECKCSGVFCNRLCSSRGGGAHAFLCVGQNPASIPFVRFIRDENWKAPGALARLAGVLLSLASKGPSAAQELTHTIDYVRGLAGLSLDKRTRVISNWQATQTASEELWKKTHLLFVQALQSPTTPADANILARLKGKGELPADILHLLFDYDGFLLGLGKMSLNMEAHGGLYVLHSHINHSCSSNISVRHITTNHSQRITIIARKNIDAGEELLASYVNPSNDVWARRRELKEWGFGVCNCERCLEEEKTAPPEGQQKVELEDELRGFLGV